MQRRLSAIVAADVVGYSRLMEVDEAGTLARLKSARESLIDPKIADHNGRIVKLMGDGALIEFGSVVDAVACALEIQQAIAESNAERPGDMRLEFRVGVNLGDVIVEGEDIYGDGVNVAARLERLADPGGILISGTAFDQVDGKMDCAFDFLGEQHVKNIEKPVRLYRVLMPAKTAAETVTRGRARRRWLPAAAAVALFAASAAGWVGFRGNFSPATDLALQSRMTLPLPDRPSIGVLPFTNLSEEPQERHFADGMTDSLITDLSKLSGLFVIARNSTFAYQGRYVKASQVAEELGVRYVLEGSVQRAGDKLRVNAQLIDALTGGHVWADRFDGDVTDVFAVQDAFVSKIVEALQLALTSEEKGNIARDKTGNVEAKQAFDEGWSHYLRFNAKDNAAAVAPLTRAIELDPHYGRANAALALVYQRAYDYQWDNELGVPRFELLVRAKSLLETAKKYPTALYFVAQAFDRLCYGNGSAARIEAGRAISLDPNDPEAHIAMAWALIISGEPKEALNFVATAMRLNPSYPPHYTLARGIALFAQNEVAQAADVLRKSVTTDSAASGLLGPLVSVLATLDRREEAWRLLADGLPEQYRQRPAFWLARYEFPFQWESRYSRVQERLYDGLRIASLPLDVTVASLTADLKDASPVAKKATAERLGWFGSLAAPAVPELVEMLQNTHTRLVAIRTLGKIGSQARSAVPALVALKDESVIGSYARQALVQIGSD